MDKQQQPTALLAAWHQFNGSNGIDDKTLMVVERT